MFEENMVKENAIEKPKQPPLIKRRHKSSDNLIKDMERDIFKEHLIKKKHLIISEIEQKFDDLIADFNKFDIHKFLNANLKKSNAPQIKRVAGKRLKLPEKCFESRSSLLSDLLEIKHIKTIYHIFIVMLILLFLATIVTDLVELGKINVGVSPIIAGFGGLLNGVLIWLSMQAITLAVYPIFKFYATVAKHYRKSPTKQMVWNVVWLLLIVSYQIVFIMAFTHSVLHFELKPATSIAVLMELTRFVMKVHAFVRTNVPRILNLKTQLKFQETAQSSHNFPKFHKFLYFLFAPTLVYRDEYPRTAKICWSKASKCFLELIGVIFYVSFLFERFLVPHYDHFGQNQEISARLLVASIFNCMIPGLLVFLCGFYGVLHAWMNAFAELLTFADRMFYKDWWNSTSFAVYYRTWNIVVHDWLYTYVYKDLYELLFRQNRILSQFFVFTISALVHEYILAFTFRFCYPVMFILFEGFGVLLMFVTKKEHKSLGNIFMWLSLALGTGIMLSLYHMEYYARKNCQPESEAFLSYFVPRSWSCNGLSDKNFGRSS